MLHTINEQEFTWKTPPNFLQLLQRAGQTGVGEIHTRIDPKTGLLAFIAIHDTESGPALGGCRCIPYVNAKEALNDALRLALMMSYKSALCNIPHGGAKAVIMRPEQINDVDAFFETFGRFVNDLNGRYITAVDSGTNPKIMDIIARQTSYVTCTSATYGGDGDVSPYTAHGVRRGIEAAIKFKLKRDDLDGITVAIQGAGHVGYYLCKELVDRGVSIVVADPDKTHLDRCIDEFKATAVGVDEIYTVQCDVFSPCALGAVLNPDTIQLLNTKIVCGSANNQLADWHHDQQLHKRGILYVPDFIVNSGGLIHAAAIYDHGHLKRAHQQIEEIYNTLMNVFEIAEHKNKTPNQVAEDIAKENLK